MAYRPRVSGGGGSLLHSDPISRTSTPRVVAGLTTLEPGAITGRRNTGKQASKQATLPPLHTTLTQWQEEEKVRTVSH